MRFREYESVSNSAPSPHSREVSAEYHLYLEDDGDVAKGEGKRKNNHGDQSKLVWSAPKSKSHITSSGSTTDRDAAKRISDANTLTLLQHQIIHTSHTLRQLCKDLFLPIGYPQSVADGYLEYQFYDSLQGLCSYLRGVVSTSAVLSATGVGDAEATAMSAAMTWAVRDGLGMIGGLLFSYVASPHFDAHVKEFRLLADVLNDIGMTLDMALPFTLTWLSSMSSRSVTLFGPWYSTVLSYLPSAYLILTSTSTLCKVSCGMAAGATKGNITDHFAIKGNRADCQSKESTQETLVSLIGMCLGVWLANVLHKLEKTGEEDTDNNSNQTNAQLITWGIFIILTLIHVWANYIGMEILRLRTLNRERAKVAMQSLVEDCGKLVLDSQSEQDANTKISESDLDKDKISHHLLSPDLVSESLWKSMCGMVRPGNIQLGISLKNLVKRTTSSSTRLSRSSRWEQGHWPSENYTIFVEDSISENKPHDIIVLLRDGSNDHDELKAFLHAHILNWCVQNAPKTKPASVSSILSRSYSVVQYVFHYCSTSSDSSIDLHNVLGKKGWDMTRLYLGFDSSRCDWEDKDE